MVSIDSKRRSDAFPISAYQTGRSGNFVDHRRDFDARFLKREEVWRDCTAFLAVLPDFWKWSAEKSGRQTKTMSPPTRLLYADHNSKRLFVSIRTCPFLLCRHWNRKWGIAAVVTAILMMFSRLYFYVHYPTDILGGILLGTVLALLSIQIVEKTLASERWKNWRNKRRDER